MRVYAMTSSLTHWSRDKWPPFSRWHFQMHFLEWKCMRLRFHRNLFLKFQFNDIQALVQIMAWRWLGDKPLFEPMMFRLLTHICVTQPQWVNLAVFDARPSACSKIITALGMNSSAMNYFEYVSSTWCYSKINAGCYYSLKEKWTDR